MSHDRLHSARPQRKATWPFLGLIAALVLSTTGGSAEQEAPAKASRGVLIRFEGPIGPMLEHYLYRKLDQAKQYKADLVVVEIDSPGGFVDSSLNVAERLGDLDWAHSVAWVPREALSGAAFVALGCGEIVIAPDAAMGDAGPIFMDENFLFRHAPEKVRTHLVQVMRKLAEARGRPPALAEAMVDMDLVVYEVENRRTGEVTYMSEMEIESHQNRDDLEKRHEVRESRKGYFLEVNGTRAVELGLAEATLSRRADLEARYQVPDGLVLLEPTAVDTAVYVLNWPIVTGLLLIVGLVALYFELNIPGIGLGGLIAFLCFALFFWSRFLGGTAGWLEVVLFVSGAVFLAMELFVIPGFGVAGVTGILLLLASLVLAGQNFILPTTSGEAVVFGRTLMVVGVSATVFILVAALLSIYMGTIPVLNRLALKPPDPTGGKPGAAAGAATVGVHSSGVEVEDRGTAVSPLRPAGKARFGDEYVDVVTEGGFVEKGSEVRVIRIRGNRVVVREVEKTE